MFESVPIPQLGPVTTLPVDKDAASAYFPLGTVEDMMNAPLSPWQIGFSNANGFNGLQPVGMEQQETREEQAQSREEKEYEDLLSFAKWLVPHPGSAWTCVQSVNFG